MADPRAERVYLTYSERLAAVRARVLAYVERAWVGLPNYRDDDIDRFVRTVAPVVTGGQRQVAALTDAYLASVSTVVLGERVRPIGVAAERVTDEAMRGTDATEVYKRTGPTVWMALAAGDTLADAVAKGRERALATADTDLQLAKTHAAREVFSSDNQITGYRRVLVGGACDLCDSVSDEVYATDELMPIHAHCNCDVEPVFERADPHIAPDVPTEDLVRLGDSTVAVRDHGELGPVLTVATHDFTRESDLND